MIRVVVVPEKYQHIIPSDFVYDATKTLDLIEPEWDRIVCKPSIFEPPMFDSHNLPSYLGPLFEVTKFGGKHNDDWSMSFEMPFSQIRETLKHDPRLISVIHFNAIGPSIIPGDKYSSKLWKQKLDKENSLFAR